jgi:predicted helicase
MASVQEILVKTFGKQDGLADSNVTLLDPASGTLTFPIMGIKLCQEVYSKQGRAGAFPSLVNEHILKNFYAFELLLAPYVIGHFKATLSLKDYGCDLTNERFQLYLTNALEMKLPASQLTLFPEIERKQSQTGTYLCYSRKSSILCKLRQQIRFHRGTYGSIQDGPGN